MRRIWPRGSAGRVGLGMHRDRKEARKTGRTIMSRKNLIAALLNLSPLIVMVCGLPPQAAAQAQIMMPVEILPGPPDLAALCSASKDNVE
jgi:hypothetical protein